MYERFISRMTSLGLSAVMVCTAANLPPIRTMAAEDAKIEAFSLADVTMTDAYCTNAFSKELKYLLSFENDRLLAGFRGIGAAGGKAAARPGIDGRCDFALELDALMGMTPTSQATQ